MQLGHPHQKALNSFTLPHLLVGSLNILIILCGYGIPTLNHFQLIEVGPRWNMYSRSFHICSARITSPNSQDQTALDAAVQAVRPNREGDSLSTIKIYNRDQFDNLVRQTCQQYKKPFSHSLICPDENTNWRVIYDQQSTLCE